MPEKDEEQQTPGSENNARSPTAENVPTKGDSGPVEEGGRVRRNVPGGDGFYISPDGGNSMYNAAKEVIRFPFDDPSDYLPRTIWTIQDLQNYRAKFSRRQRMYTGWSDPQLLDEIMMAGYISIGGRGRAEFVAITTGEQKLNFMQRAVNGVQDRVKQLRPGKPNEQQQG